MGIVLEKALSMKSKLKVMANKATYRNPLEGHDSDDLLQGLFTKIIEKEDSYNNEKSSPVTWIYTVFRNYISNQTRRQGITPLRYYSGIIKESQHGGEELDGATSPYLNAEDLKYPDRIEGIDRKDSLRYATKNLLSWLKDEDYEGYKVLNAMLRHKANRYDASIEADISIREINCIITRIRSYDLTKRLKEL